MKVFGQGGPITAVLQWSRREPRALAWGALHVAVGGRSLWGEAGEGALWTWIDLLEHLGHAWPYLVHEQAWPAAIAPGDPRRLLSDRWFQRRFGDAAPAEVERDLYTFSRRHDLASGIAGMYLPSLVVVREGRRMWVGTESWVERAEAQRVLETLAALGDEIADRVDDAGDPRADLAVARWRARDEQPRALVLSLELGVSQAAWADAWDGEDWMAEVRVDAGACDDQPVLAAARMSSVAPVAVQQAIARAVHTARGGRFDAIDALSYRAVEFHRHHRAPAFEQGLRLAQWFRDHLGLSDDDRADPAAILDDLGVVVSERAFGTPEIDAVAFWDRARGPGILVNTDGRHARGAAGRRTTLAHELAHLLIDRAGSLPVAEVLGAAAPVLPEKRANAFAAELLAPQAGVHRRLAASATPRATLHEVCADYQASRTVVGWQVRNHADSWALLSPQDRKLVTRWTEPWRRADDGAL